MGGLYSAQVHVDLTIALRPSHGQTLDIDTFLQYCATVAKQGTSGGGGSRKGSIFSRGFVFILSVAHYSLLQLLCVCRGITQGAFLLYFHNLRCLCIPIPIGLEERRLAAARRHLPGPKLPLPRCFSSRYALEICRPVISIERSLLLFAANFANSKIVLVYCELWCRCTAGFALRGHWCERDRP